MTGIETALIAAGVGTKTAAFVTSASGLATVATGAGAALSAVGSIKEGNAAKASASFQAEQYRQKAKQENAITQRQGLERKRQIDLAQSRTRALSAASGVSSASPTIANILAGLDNEAQYAFDTSIVAGQESATGLQTAADVQVLAGKQAKTAGMYGALTGISQFALSNAAYSGGSSSKKLPRIK
jgi:hypothetical protein